jgi:lactose/L-arabinose transport system substrate-binding protein
MHRSITARLGAIAFAGASLLAMTAADAAKVTVWCWDPHFNVAIMKEAGARYAKTHPDFELNVVDFAKIDVEQKLQTGLASGVSDGLPDIVLIEDYGAQKYLQSFPGSFAPLSDKVDYKGFAPYKVELATVDGKVYSMPFDSGVTGFYYRKDYIEAAGYKPADMQNISWDKYIEIGKAVEAKTGHKMLGLDPNDDGYVRIIMQSAGSWYFDKDGKTTITDNAGLRAALETVGKIMKANIYKPVAGWNNWTGAFTSGDVASVFTGVWITGTVKSQADQKGKWGVAPLPKLDLPGAVAASNLGGSSWYVLAGSKVKDESIDFLNEIYGKDIDFYQKILVDQGAVGSLLAAREGAAYKSNDDFFGGEPIWQNFSNWLAEVPSVNYGIFTNEVDSAIAANLPSLAKDTSIDDVLKAVEAQVKTQTE